MFTPLPNRMVVEIRAICDDLLFVCTGIFKRAATGALRKHREGVSRAAALPIGDILLHQSRGGDVRRFIRAKIEQATPPVTLIAHSLGGIASVDLLALPNPPKVERLVTAGSQSPLLYELGALFSLQPPQPLPDYFPPLKPIEPL